MTTSPTPTYAEIKARHDREETRFKLCAPPRRCTRLQKDRVALLQMVERLAEALTEMEAMYTYAWDRTDGGLTMFPESVARFDEACRKARVALGKPLFGDNGESVDDEPSLALPQEPGK